MRLARTQDISDTTTPRVRNFTELASDAELSSVVTEFFKADQTNLLPLVQINLQGYHNTSNMTEDRAPEP